MSYITIDDYYDVTFYNECLESLKNNNVDYNEYINVKDFRWYIDVPSEPIMVNYDKINNSQERFLVNKVHALRPNEEYLFTRRLDDKGKKAMTKYIENTPMRESRESKYSVFFNAKSQEELQRITKDLPIKIYYFGKYYNNKYKVCLCNNEMILNYIEQSQILLEKTNNEIGMFEAELNFKVFRGNDMLQKYSETPYFENGIYNDVNIRDKRIKSI